MLLELIQRTEWGLVLCDSVKSQLPFGALVTSIVRKIFALHDYDNF